MTPKEKAEELVGKMCLNDCTNKNINKAKKCALIAVEEIINIENIKPYILHKEIIKFYQEVKKEIEKL
jgi:hypothetical protein